jgi:alpha-D-xyloside xylohydrolase
MKFTDGYWLTRAGMNVEFAAEAYDVTATESSLIVHAPTRAITSRGDTLNRPVLTMTLSSPLEGVVRVRLEHHVGGGRPRPAFDIADAAPAVKVEEDDGVARLTSGPLQVRVRRGAPWSVEFLDVGGDGGGVARERILTASGHKSVGYATAADGSHYLHEQLSLGVGEAIYGLGERFGPVVKNGQRVDIWNADGGTSSDQAYKSVPFFLSSRGYGVLVDHPGLVSFEVGSELVSRTQFSVRGESLEYLVVAGPTPKDVLERYTALTGRPARVPEWSYGMWLTTSFTTDYDEGTVTRFVEGMAERDLPLSVFHFDCFWMRELNWCDFEWDPRVFPDPEGMLARLKARGLRICVWINPYIAQRSPLFAEGAARGYLVRRADGSVWQWDQWQAGMGLVDFTNPEAAAWYAGHLERLLDQGVDAFKTDFGERIPTDVVWHDGSDPERMHNHYAQQYNRTVFELLERRRGAGEAVLFARAATAGGQQLPVHWGGDCESTFASMAETLRGGLSLAASGFGFWSHDIGGFEGTPDPEVFKRWLAFGLLSSHSRLHGSSSYRVPWAFDEEAVDVARHFTHLKHRLMPYLVAAGEEAHERGIPVLRPTLLEFPQDPTALRLETQYLLGERLLVAPVFTPGGEVTFYVPEGSWTHLLTGERLTGPRWVTETHGADSLPLLVRPGTVLPLGARTDRPDYDYADGVTLELFELAVGARVRTVVPALGGDPARAATFDVVRDDAGIAVTAHGTAAPWRVVVRAGDGAGTSARAPAGTSRVHLAVTP